MKKVFPLCLAGMVLGLFCWGCATAPKKINKYEIAPRPYPAAIKIGESLVFEARALTLEGDQVKNPDTMNIPTWLVDHPEHCRVEPRKGMRATLQGVAAGPCRLVLRAKVKVGLNEIEAWNGEITE